MIFINGRLGDAPNCWIFAPYIGSFVRPFAMSAGGGADWRLRRCRCALKIAGGASRLPSYRRHSQLDSRSPACSHVGKNVHHQRPSGQKARPHSYESASWFVTVLSFTKRRPPMLPEEVVERFSQQSLDGDILFDGEGVQRLRHGRRKVATDGSLPYPTPRRRL